MPEEGVNLIEKSHIMSLEEIISIAKVYQKLGVDTVRLTGGEPLVRKNVDFLVKELAALGLKLKITTNGILLDKYLDLFEEIGLKKINISLDSLNKNKAAFITKRDYFDRIMRNIDLALDKDMDIKLNIVIIKGVNDVELLDFIRLTQKQKITVKFIEFMPFKGNQWDWSKGVSQQEILDRAQKEFGSLEILENPKHSTSVNFKVKNALGNFGIISTITHPFCSECNRIRLTADGKMKNCLFANKEVDILTAYRKGEDIEKLILESIKQKKFSRDGMELKMDKKQYENNRSMISIGG